MSQNSFHRVGRTKADTWLCLSSFSFKFVIPDTCVREPDILIACGALRLSSEKGVISSGPPKIF